MCDKKEEELVHKQVQTIPLGFFFFFFLRNLDFETFKKLL